VLAGVRVADFTQALAGPLCTMLLADLGADVVKVEPPGGDQTRGWGPPFLDGDATYYYSLNSGKRSAVFDLKTPEGRAAALELVLSADVVVENFRPGVMARFELDYESVRDLRPELVYCSISGFGGGAPSNLGGYDMVFQALSGIMNLTGHPEMEPVKAGIPLVDEMAGMYATVGVLAALYEARETGLGQFVDVSLLGAGIAALANRAAAELIGGTTEERLGNAHPSVSPYEVYRAADGSFALAAPNEALWRKVCEGLGRDELADDPRFRTNELRVERRAELKAEIERTTVAEAAQHWTDRLIAAGVPAGSVNDIPGAFRFAETVGLDMQELAHHADEARDGVPIVSSPLKLSGSRARDVTPPRLGEHTEEVLAELAQARMGTG
jgi:crotonobetainyl-CoA:carnitine CoA-transferase CaiB-like acyl-CoA transferase